MPLKEFIIGSLFAAGTLVGVTPHIFVERSAMIFAAILFASLCSLNCVSFAIWERDLDRIQGKHSIARDWAHAKFLADMFLLALSAASGPFPQFAPCSCTLSLSAGASKRCLVCPSFV